MTLTAVLKIVLDIAFPRSRRDAAVDTLTVSSLAPRLAPKHVCSALTLFDYRDPLIRNMIWMLKYRGNTRALQLCAALLHETLVGERADELLPDTAQFVIIPIPLSRKRLRHRGFNQTALLGEALAAHAPHLWEHQSDTLIKIRETAPQSSLPRVRRLTNVAGAFSVTHAEKIRDRTVILLDDVITTGSTVRAAARVLEQAGAKRVMPVALAH